ncbi:MAG: T9SS type A sorting domain-containing protein [Bacteroidia bacterium]
MPQLTGMIYKYLLKLIKGSALVTCMLPAAVSAQIACAYRFEHSVQTPYQALPDAPSTQVLASGAFHAEFPDILSPTDEAFFENQPLGFSFSYNGQSYSSIGISSNGWIWLGGFNPVRVAGVQIPFTQVLQTEMPFEGIISALNQDLEGRWSGEEASIKTAMAGTAPNRTFTIEWRNFKINADPEGVGYCGELRNRLDFQIILKEQNSKIEFAYNMAGYCFQGFEAYFQIGLRGSDPKDVHTRQINAGAQAWMQSQLGLPPAQAVMRSSAPVTLPQANLRFIFTPAAPESLTWQGFNSNWFDPQNWSGGIVPNRCNTVTIPSGLSHYPILSGAQAASCAALEIESGASVLLESNYASFLSVFGTLRVNGQLINRSAAYITLAGTQNANLSGEGAFNEADLFITAGAEYHSIGNLVIRSIHIQTGAALYLDNAAIDVFGIAQFGHLYQGNGLLLIEGDAASVQLTDSTFFEEQGTTVFGNSTLWNHPSNQVVPSIAYNKLWIITRNGYSVQLGTNLPFTCRDLLFCNSGAAGGVAETAQELTVSGTIKLGIDSLPGTVFVLNHRIHQTNGQSPFDMHANDRLLVRYAAPGQNVLSGTENPQFNGTVEYQSNQTQQVMKGDYRNLNISGSGLRVASGAVNLKGILTLEQGTFNTSDSLILRSDAQGTALVSGQGNGQLNGLARQERYLGENGNPQVFFSSPVEQLHWDSLRAGWNMVPVYEHGAAGWQLWNGSDAFVNTDEAYRAEIVGTSTLKARGTLQLNNKYIPLLNQHESWSLVGNPYPAPLDWDKVVAAQSATFNPAVYRAAGSGPFNGHYSAWLSTGPNEGLGVNGASPYISAMEGFMVSGATNDTLRLSHTYCADVVNLSAEKGQSSLPYFKINLRKGIQSDEVLVYFSNQVQTSVKKRIPMGSQTYWYTLDDLQQNAIQARTAPLNADTIPLNIHVAEAGMHTIAMNAIKNLPLTALVYLEDRQTQSKYNLNANPELSFSLNAGEIANRFYLNYYRGVDVLLHDAGCSGNEGSIELQYQGSKSWSAAIFNETNVHLAEYENLNGSYVIDDLPAGLYRMVFTLEAENLQMEAWYRIEAGDYISADMMLSGQQVLTGQELLSLICLNNDAENISWNLGDGMLVQGADSLVHLYQEPGNYEVVLTVAKGACLDTARATVTAVPTTGITENEKSSLAAAFYPNPASESTRLNLNDATLNGKCTVSLIDMRGKVVRQNELMLQNGSLVYSLSGISDGRYEVLITSGNLRKTASLQVVNP